MQNHHGPAQSVSATLQTLRYQAYTFSSDYPKLKREFYLSGEDKKILTPKERYKLDLVLLAYWTCLQLESYVAVLVSSSVAR
jgi:hypothetical protein